MLAYLSKQFQDTSATKKQNLSHLVKELVKMTDNVITITNDKVNATENSVNFSTKMFDHL
jgi:ABC-type molybdate transport system ATPase subunit